jgi:uncharacterized protein YrrD
MRLSEADGRPVLSRTSAEGIGELRHVVIDVPGRRIRALHVAGKGRKATLVDWSSVVGFGPDGIVVESAERGRAARDDTETAVASGDLDLDGRLVLSDAGDSMGSLTDVVFDEGSGRLERFVTGEAEHDAGRLRAVGPYCVILRAE